MKTLRLASLPFGLSLKEKPPPETMGEQLKTQAFYRLFHWNRH
jgi:hypothetical protein